MKKLLFIMLLVTLVGSLGFIGYQEYAKKQKQEELARNRKYEVSMVKALKNSYRDLKELKISNPVYNDQKPGPSWHCHLTLIFSDNFTITYDISHNLEIEEKPGTVIGVFDEDKWETLKEYDGETKETVTVYYSNGDKGEQ